ncbi:peptidoglycan-binding protein [Kitasatospora sp. NPDC050543]|uniref:peptidoglycan-binding protein n=1 Tax=Kitasatospora sp. NPDC050543 TaxID=3364054 RepID=UPI0037BB00CD
MTQLLEFEEVEPGEDCICAGCTGRRRARLHAARVHDGGHPAARSVRRRAAVLVAAVGTALGGAAAASAAAAGPAASPAPGGGTAQPPRSPQGEVGAQALTAAPGVTRAQIIERARSWLDQRVPYSMSRYWSDGYRQDCSGFVSMAWGLDSSQTTWTLPMFADRITEDELLPGDILLFNNAADPQAGSHVTIFGGWADAARTRYTAYEQTAPGTTSRSTPYAYWSNSAGYLPYRYLGLAADATGGSGSGGDGGAGGSSDRVPATALPGVGSFGPGADNAYVTRLGELLGKRGGARFYGQGPGPVWGEADRLATQAFQQAQGWSGTEADGLPGADTWDYLVNGRGGDIPAAPGPAPAPGTRTTPPTGTPGSAPAFPGADSFGPGRSDPAVQQLGEQLVRLGFGGHYTRGPDPTWGEADRLATQAFQQAQGWSGAAADGYPGPETWRRLFA